MKRIVRLCYYLAITSAFPFIANAAVVSNEPMETFSITPAPLKNAGATNVNATSNLLSFRFQSVSIRALLQIIAQASGNDFVISDAVKGDTSLQLTNVTWQKALRTVLDSHNLTSHHEGGVIYITTIEELAANLTKKLQTEKALSDLEPLNTSIIALKYTDAALMADLLKSSGSSNLLSSRGSVSIDPRTNSVIVSDTNKVLNLVRRTLAKLDVPARQVLIEARIVNINTSYESQLGVRFGVSNMSHLTGSLAGAAQLTQRTLPAYVSPVTNRLNFNLPANALSDGSNPASIGLALAKLGPILLDLELSALESEGHVQIISKPRVVTSNQQKATILTGEEIPYQEASSSGATTTSFKKAVLSLEVTPLITPDDKIVLKLKASQDTRGQQLITTPTVTSGSSSTTSGTSSSGITTVVPATYGPPSINTQQVESSILLKNNETFVVGGVYQLTSNNTVDRIPFLGKLPVIGNLFSQKGIQNTKSELLIFITPKIIQQKPIA